MVILMANLKQIEKYLHKLKLPYKVIDLGEEVFTVRGAVASGVDAEEIVKTLIMNLHGITPMVSSFSSLTRPDLWLGKASSLDLRLEGIKLGKIKYQNVQRSFNNLIFATLAIRGKDRLDFKKVRKLFGSKAELAKSDEVLKVCGVPIGAVCPILLDISVFFDQKVMNLSRVNMGSGNLKHGLEIDLPNLLKAVG